MSAVQGVIRKEIAVGFGAITALLYFVLGSDWLHDLSHTLWFVVHFSWLFGTMLWLSFSVVRHADGLAIKLGEPYGTLILTLSVISIEVIMISAVMLTGSENPTLARDTMFAVLMIVLNGMVGVTLLVGGLRHGAPEYNLQGATSFLSVMIPLAVLSLVLPRFTESTEDASASGVLTTFLIAACVVLYGIFLSIQTMRHRSYFVQPGDSAGDEDDDHGGLVVRSIPFHVVLLLLSMLPIVLLSKNMAKVIDHGIASVGAPSALGGFLVAILVLAPEGMGAVRAAVNNKLQRSMNICLGSGLATIALTVPSVLIVGLVTHKTVELGLGTVDMIFVLLTLSVSIVNFSSGRTNILQGAVHLLLFAGYVVIIFD